MSTIKMLFIAGAVAATTTVAVSASAQVTATFTAGDSVAGTTGFGVVQNFNGGAGSYGLSGSTGSGFQICNTSIGGVCTAPNGSGSPFLAVLGGGTVTYTLPYATSAVEFDWGTASAGDSLTFLTNKGEFAYAGVPNSDGGATPPGGNYNKNGLLVAQATAGTVITGLRFGATQNSFELDNISAAVPEPATWGMMILGFSMLGVALRRRERAVAAAA